MRLTSVLLASSLVGCTFSQATQQPEVFDVASVRPDPGPAPSAGGKFSVSGSRLTVNFYSLFGLIMFAYDVKPYQIPGASTLDHTFYDIAADAGDGRPRTKAEFRPMMQALLADRFKLRVHREFKEMPVYALAVGTSGAKLQGKRTCRPRVTSPMAFQRYVPWRAYSKLPELHHGAVRRYHPRQRWHGPSGYKQDRTDRDLQYRANLCPGESYGPRTRQQSGRRPLYRD